MKGEQEMERYDQMVLMLGYLSIANETESSLERKVQILDKFSLSDNEISKICGCTKQSIANARQNIKKRLNKKRK